MACNALRLALFSFPLSCCSISHNKNEAQHVIFITSKTDGLLPLAVATVFLIVFIFLNTSNLGPPLLHSLMPNEHWSAKMSFLLWSTSFISSWPFSIIFAPMGNENSFLTFRLVFYSMIPIAIQSIRFEWLWLPFYLTRKQFSYSPPPPKLWPSCTYVYVSTSGDDE